MGIFRRGNEKHTLSLAMTDVRLGDRLLFIGCSDPSLLAAIASKVGLSGRACALVSSDGDQTRARSGAERGGLLIEIERAPLDAFPYPDGSFDVTVIDNQDGVIAHVRPELRMAALQEAHRILTPRGRLLVIERAGRGMLGGLIRQPAPDPEYLQLGGALGALKGVGFKAVRQLAERDGLSFFEGIA